MSSPRSHRVVATACSCFVVVALHGCALLDKADVLNTRYFEPNVPRAQRDREPATTNTGAPMELILGRATANGYLKSRLVYRTSSVEVGTYEDRQWTERPEEYARRAVAHALFDTLGIAQVLSGESPTLEIDLAAFEEIRHGKRSIGRVTIRFVLRDESSVWISDAITVDRATKGGSQEPEAVVAALSKALTRAAGDISKTVADRLKEPAPAESIKPSAQPCAPSTEDPANPPRR